MGRVTPYRYGQEGLARVGQALMFRAARPRRWPAIAAFAIFVGIFCRADALRGFATAAPNPAARSNEMNLWMAGAVAASVVASASSAQDAVQWRIEDGGNGHWYGVCSSPVTDMTWQQMREAASGLGGHLITISNAAEDSFAFNYFVSLQRDMMGGPLGLFRSPAGTWQWVTGEALTYTNWRGPCCGNPAAPDNGPLQPFATWIGPEQQASIIGRWEDWSDAELGNPALPFSEFMVEWDADCNGDGVVDYGQITSGDLLDINRNNVPDCCEEGTTCVPSAVEWSTAAGGNGHWYAVIAGLPVSWSQWNAVASTMGAHLLTISGVNEQNFIMSAYGGSMLGLRAVAGSTGYAWVTGEPLNFQSWGGSACSSGPYPNNPTSQERFVALRRDPCGDVWDDFFATELGALIGVTIEWSADCNSDGIVDFGQIRAGDLADTNANNIPDCCETGTICGCPADVILDGVVNGIDLAVIINAWSTDGGKFPRADIDGNGLVDGADLAIVLGSWGPCS